MKVTLKQLEVKSIPTVKYGYTYVTVSTQVKNIHPQLWGTLAEAAANAITNNRQNVEFFELAVE